MAQGIFSEAVLPDAAVSRGAREERPPEQDPALLRQIVQTTARALAKHGGAAPSSEALSQIVQVVMELAEGRSVMLRLGERMNAANRKNVQTFLDTLLRATGDLPSSRQETAISELAKLMLPDPLVDARGTLALDNLVLRDRFIAETSPLTSAQVADQAGSKGSNPYATAARWKKMGDIFSVKHRGVEYFPAFQFRDGQPHPTIKVVLTALPERLSAWQRAFWFVSTNGWLSDAAPVDLLGDPAALMSAAAHEAEQVFG